MTYSLTPSELVAMMLDASSKLDEAQQTLEAGLHREARNERDYRKGRAEAWVSIPATVTTAKAKEDWVDGKTADLRFARDSATATAKSAMEMVRNKRQILSSLQSASNSIREEAALSRTGPDFTGL